jgi:pyruvate dehydrogenase E1 component alpha subunit
MAVLPAERDLRRVIGDGEGVPDGEVEGLSDDDLLELHRWLVLLRTYDERSVVYHRQGRIGTYAIFWNHEAMQAGSVFALERDDWIFPSYRESAIGLLRGMPASTILSWWRGHPAGWWNPLDWNVASICVPIGTHVPHAAGLAWGKKLRGEQACAIAYFGDGATSEGAFHEGANFAAVMRAPVVLFCNNNQWAISTPLSAQTAAETLADKAAGYGMPGVRVHATADDPSAYIDAARVEEEKKRECLGRYEAYLRRVGLLSDEAAEAVRAQAADVMREGIAAAEAEPPADPALVFSHAYVDPPASLESDLAELRRVLDA